MIGENQTSLVCVEVVRDYLIHDPRRLGCNINQTKKQSNKNTTRTHDTRGKPQIGEKPWSHRSFTMLEEKMRKKAYINTLVAEKYI